MKQGKICLIAMTLAVVYSIGLIFTASVIPQKSQDNDDTVLVSEGLSMEYKNKIFNSDFVHKVHIQLPENEWNDLKDRAFYKSVYDATVTIDGETFYHVGIRTKGNVTLVQSVVRDWNRYSLVMDFGAFDASQRYYGLDKLALNNNICDSSFMRDYLCYDMMRTMNVPAPLCSFTALYLNDEYLGLYSNVEYMDESYCVRNFGYDYGNLYKPEHMNISGMLTGEETDCKLNINALSGDHGVDAADFLGVSDTTVSLKYQGEALSNYSDIWDNAVFDIGKNDKKRVVNALKTISDGNNLETVLDTDMLLRYFAVNAFVLNDDTYTSYAGHNYGLYEKDGRLTMLPWDYDHSLGCMGAASGSATWTELINLPIDDPVINVAMENRPVIDKLLKNEDYKIQYYNYLDEFLKAYIENGYMENKVTELKELLLPYVEKEPADGISREKFDSAVKSNMDYCNYRSSSIRKQLSGEIPTTAIGQKAHPDTLVDCSGFQSPDSGSLTELLFPEGSGLYFEDLITAIVPRVNTTATVSIIPIETIKDLAFPSSDGGFVKRMEESGKVKDSDAIRDGIRQLVLNFITEILTLFLTPIVLAFALIFAFKYGNKHRAKSLKKKGGSI